MPAVSFSVLAGLMDVIMGHETIKGIKANPGGDDNRCLPRGKAILQNKLMRS